MKINRIGGVFVGTLKCSGKFYYASHKDREQLIIGLLNMANKNEI